MSWGGDWEKRAVGRDVERAGACTVVIVMNFSRGVNGGLCKWDKAATTSGELNPFIYFLFVAPDLARFRASHVAGQPCYLVQSPDIILCLPFAFCSHFRASQFSVGVPCSSYIERALTVRCQKQSRRDPRRLRAKRRAFDSSQRRRKLQARFSVGVKTR